jgi:predicted ATPase
MGRIKVKNFGPIKEGYKDDDGWIDIRKVTLFIGSQGAGKSTLAKLISTFVWMEKVLKRGDYTIEQFSRKDVLRERLDYHGIGTYFKGMPYGDSDSTEVKSSIEYEGDAYTFKYDERWLRIEEIEDRKYDLPQIMYVPSQRNYLSLTDAPKQQRRLLPALVELLTEMEAALEQLSSDLLKLPINDVSIGYDQYKEVPYIKGKDYKLDLEVASSGYQSISPLYVVSRYLANSVKYMADFKEPMTSKELARFRGDVIEIQNNPTFSESQKRTAISALGYRYAKTAFINIVEEPEQNLFPTSQWEILQSLLEFNNMRNGNKLILTSHSPYIISYLTLAVKALLVEKKINSASNKEELYAALEKIVPTQSRVLGEDLVIYELDNAGNVIKLEDYKGLPSDENYLNDMLEESNQLFAKMIKIEDSCR